MSMHKKAAPNKSPWLDWRSYRDVAKGFFQGAHDGALSTLQGAVRGVENLNNLATTAAKVPIYVHSGLMGSVPKALGYAAKKVGANGLHSWLDNKANSIWKGGQDAAAAIDNYRSWVSKFRDYSDKYYQSKLYDPNLSSLSVSRAAGEHALPLIASFYGGPSAAAARGAKGFFSGMSDTAAMKLYKGINNYALSPTNMAKLYKIPYRAIGNLGFTPKAARSVYRMQPAYWDKGLGILMDRGVKAAGRIGNALPPVRAAVNMGKNFAKTPAAQTVYNNVIKPVTNSSFARYIRKPGVRNFAASIAGKWFPLADKAFGITQEDGNDRDITRVTKRLTRYGLPFVGARLNPKPFVDGVWLGTYGGWDPVAEGAGYGLTRRLDIGDKTSFGNAEAAVNAADRWLPGLKGYVTDPFNKQNMDRLGKSVMYEYKRNKPIYDQTAIALGGMASAWWLNNKASKKPGPQGPNGPQQPVPQNPAPVPSPYQQPAPHNPAPNGPQQPSPQDPQNEPKRKPITMEDIKNLPAVRHWETVIPNNVITRLVGLKPTTPTVIEGLNKLLRPITSRVVPSHMYKGPMAIYDGANRAYRESAAVRRAMIGDKGNNYIDIAKNQIVPGLKQEVARYHQEGPLRYLRNLGHDIKHQNSRTNPATDMLIRPVANIGYGIARDNLRRNPQVRKLEKVVGKKIPERIQDLPSVPDWVIDAGDMVTDIYRQGRGWYGGNKGHIDNAIRIKNGYDLARDAYDYMRLPPNTTK